MVKTEIIDGIMIAKFKSKVNMSLEDAEQLVAKRLEKQKGVKYPLIIHVNNAVSYSKMVRRYMASKGTEGISHGAFVVKNDFEMNYIKFFLAADAINMPIEIFTSEDDAIAWVKRVSINNDRNYL